MAMRIVTLDRLGDFIDDTTGSKHIMSISEGTILFVDKSTNNISCSLPVSKVSNMHEEIPFLKFRDQFEGSVMVCDEVVSDEAILPYSYWLD